MTMTNPFVMEICSKGYFSIIVIIHKQLCNCKCSKHRASRVVVNNVSNVKISTALFVTYFRDINILDFSSTRYPHVSDVLFLENLPAIEIQFIHRSNSKSYEKQKSWLAMKVS